MLQRETQLLTIQTTYKSRFEGEGTWLHWVFEHAFSSMILLSLIFTGGYQYYKMTKDKQKKQADIERQQQMLQGVAANGGKASRDFSGSGMMNDY